MRVISGSRRGLKLKSPKGMDIRPTEDRVKESVFNIISPIREDAVVLDCFSGTGAIGIEFLSRGAKKAYLVDKSNHSIDIIKDNIKFSKFEAEAEVIRGDIFKLLNVFLSKNILFDYIYIDPPYKEYDVISKLLYLIDSNFKIDKHTMIIVEHDTNYHNTIDYTTIMKYDSRVYGSKIISFYRGTSL